MKMHIIKSTLLGVCLIAASLCSAQKTTSFKWEGLFTVEAGSGIKGGAAIKVADTSIDSGAYAISNVLPVKNTSGYELSSWCKTDGKATSGAAIYIRCENNAGKLLKVYSSGPTKSSEWVKLTCRISGGEIPEGTTRLRIMMQSAVGAAKETGTAWFDEISLFSVEAMELAMGQNEYTSDVFAKGSSWATPLAKNGPELAVDGKNTSSWRPDSNDMTPWLELSWRDALPGVKVLLMPGSAANIERISIASWDDQQQKWNSHGEIVPTKSEGYLRLAIPDNIATRKMKIEFSNRDGNLEISEVRLLATPLKEENWQASWIWFTKERVEYISRYFRKKIMLEDEVESAYFQGTADDRATFYVNGNKIRSGASWDSSASSEITKFLKKGENIISVDNYNARYAAGIIAEIDINLKSGKSVKIITDESWVSSPDKPDGWLKSEYDDSAWKPSVLLGVPPDGAWGKIKYVNNAKRKEIILANQPLPGKIEAGKQLKLRFDLTLPVDDEFDVPVYLRMSRSKSVFVRQRLDGSVLKNAAENNGKAMLEISFTPSRYLYHGNYDLSLEIPFYSVKFEGKEWIQRVKLINSANPAPVNAEVKPVNGMPVLHLDGSPVMSMFYSTRGGGGSYMQPNMHRLYSANQMHMTICSISPNMPAPDKYDFIEVDRQIAEALDNNSEAKIILKPGFRDIVPGWFDKRYPEEMVVFDGGKRYGKPSLASKQWREIVGNMLRELIRHVQNGPYSDRVIGYYICEGEEGQWMHYWGGSDLSKDNVLSDYSPAMQEYFSGWLKSKYQDESALQKAWKDDNASFVNPRIPDKLERLEGGIGMFRDPVKSRRAIDYAEALSDVICEGIAWYGAIVKEETQRKAIMMAYYGHIMDLGVHFLGEQVGYLKQRAAIDCPDVDCFTGPISYHSQFRDIGGTAAFDYPPPPSLRMKNKIWLNECDVRTHLTNPPGYAYSVRHSYQTDEVLAREFAKALCGGAGLYWHNLSGGKRDWYDDPQIVKTMGLLNNIGQEAVKSNLSRVSQIAVIFSEKSLLFSRQIQPRQKSDAMMLHCVLQREFIGRIGAPFDKYLLDDFLNPDMPEYQFYIFMNPWHMTSEELTAINNKLRKNKATALWFYAPGVVSKAGITEKAELAGIKLEMFKRPIEVRMKLKPGNSLLAEYSGEFGLSKGHAQSPLFLPAAGNYETLAVIGENGKPGLVKSEQDGLTTYFCVAPLLPPEILRAIAATAGVHIYTDSNDAVYASGDYLAIHTNRKPGARTLLLPNESMVEQLYPVVAEQRSQVTRKINFSASEPQTRIFRLKKK